MPDYISIPLPCGKFAVVDAADYDRVNQFRWHASPGRVKRDGVERWYARRRDDKTIPLHRFILDAPDGVEVDHKDGDGLNCRRANLRLATRAQNAQNIGKRRESSSIYKGVVWRTERGYWYACLVSNGKRYRTGRCESEVEAARRYDDLARLHHGEFAHLNFPEEGRVSE